MSTFKNAFQKAFVGIKGDQASDPGTAVELDNGFIMASGISTEYLKETGAPYTLGPGSFGMFSQENWQSVVVGDLEDNNCCPLILASASILTDDKIGPFHGGYLRSHKSKYIHPRRITKFYRVDPCTPQAAVVHVGWTNYTSTLSPFSPGLDECCFEFYCDETYTLRVDVKGSPALRFANHNIYQDLQADGGCCTGDSPEVVDSTLIMIQWAQEIIENEYLKDYVKPIVFDEDENPWFATAADATTAGWPATQIWTNYVSAGHTDGACAGLRLQGAYVDTKFKTCSFQITDHFEKEPIIILASMRDEVGNPCAFEGLCVYTECYGRQGIGFGENVLREIIMSESYLQNKLHSDIRIREITQGDDILDSVDRDTNYTRYYIQHTVPQNANNNQNYDQQQYLLEVITAGVSDGFETFMDTWLGTCGDCVTMETESCTDCTPEDIPTP